MGFGEVEFGGLERLALDSKSFTFSFGDLESPGNPVGVWAESK